MVDSLVLKIDRNLDKNDFDKVLGYMPQDKQEKIKRFFRFEDAQRSLLGDVLARYAICKRLSISNKALVFGANEYGKPILLHPTGIHFNISHSGNWVVCAVDDAPVGIDVEEIKPINLKIAERFFSKDEFLYISKQPTEMQSIFFYKLWTLKESYVKAEGKGLSIPLDSFSIIPQEHAISLTSESTTKGYCFYQTFLDTDSVLALCTLDRDPKESLHMNIDYFLKEVFLYE